MHISNRNIQHKELGLKQLGRVSFHAKVACVGRLVWCFPYQKKWGESHALQPSFT